MRLMCLSWWLWMFKMFMRTCPQCGHLFGRHRYRRDGSFID